MTRECNICFKNSPHLWRCFINNKCTFRTCACCVGKSLTYNKENLDVVLKCPNCRKESIFNKHTRITKMIKGNRGILLKIYREQREYIQVLQERFANINHYTNIINITTEPVQDTAGNYIPSALSTEDLDYFFGGAGASNHNADMPEPAVAVMEQDDI